MEGELNDVQSGGRSGHAVIIPKHMKGNISRRCDTCDFFGCK